MKLIKNIHWLFLFLATSLISCEKDETENLQNENTTNVPEGYVKVSFWGEDAATRAASSGPSSRIKHLQFLLYKLDGGAYKLDKSNSKVLFSNQSSVNWPLEDKHLQTMMLPINNSYKVVFLGNVDKSVFGQTDEVLTGVEADANFDAARIHAPSVAFSDNTMYHLGVSEFNTNSEEGTSKNINILLQRIVSRTVLATYGISDGMDTNTGEPRSNYASKYFYSLLDNEHPLTIKDVVFGVEGALGKQFLELLKKDIIFPVAYMLKKNGKLPADKNFAKWYSSVENDDTFWAKYIPAYMADAMYTGNESDVKSDMQSFMNTQSTESFFGNDSGSGEQSTQVSGFMEELFNKGTAFQEMTAKVRTTDVRDFNGTVMDGTGSYTLTKRVVATQLKLEQNGKGFMTTWRGLQIDNVNIALKGDMPETIDFNLAITGKSSGKTLKVGLSAADNAEEKDRSLSIALLGDKSGIIKFDFTTITKEDGTSIPLSGTYVATEQGLLPNKSQTLKLTPVNLNLGNKVTANTSKICFSYGSLLGAVSKLPEISQNSLYSMREYVFKPALMAAYGLIKKDSRYIDLEDEKGYLYSSFLGTKAPQYCIDFQIPDFSNDNFTGDLEWQIN